MPNQYYPGWSIQAVEPTGSALLEVAATCDAAPSTCPQCGGAAQKYGRKAVRFTEAPVRNHQVIVRVDRQRYRCNACNSTFMQPLREMDDAHRMSVRCRHYIERQSQLKPKSHVARDVGIDEKVVRQIAAKVRNYQGKLQNTTSPRLAIEFLQRSGGAYTLILDLKFGTPLEIVSGSDPEDISRCLRSLSGNGHPKFLVLSMFTSYLKAVQSTLPGAAVFLNRRSAEARLQSALALPMAQARAEKLLTDHLEGLVSEFARIWRARHPQSVRALIKQWCRRAGELNEPLVDAFATEMRRWEPEILASCAAASSRLDKSIDSIVRRVKRTFDTVVGEASFEEVRAAVLATKGQLDSLSGKVVSAKRFAACVCCKALFRSDGASATHIVPHPKGQADWSNGIALCGECDRSGILGWFASGETC